MPINSNKKEKESLKSGRAAFKLLKQPAHAAGGAAEQRTAEGGGSQKPRFSRT
jgi:hypothetical protein